MNTQLIFGAFLIVSIAIFFWYAEKKSQSVKPGKDGRKGYKRRNPNRYNPVLPKKRKPKQ